MGIEYKPLSKNERINRCSAILANGCQCPRAGEFHVVEDGKISQQQICSRCKTLQEAQFELAPKVYTSFDIEKKDQVEQAESKEEKTPASVPVTQASSEKLTQEKDVKPNVPTTTGTGANPSTPSVGKPPETSNSNTSK